MVRQVTLEEATAKSTQLNIMFMETSAKAGHNVKSLFKKIAMSLPGMEKESQTDTNTSTPGLIISALDSVALLLIGGSQKLTSLHQPQTRYRRHHSVSAESGYYYARRVHDATIHIPTIPFIFAPRIVLIGLDIPVRG